MAGVLQNAHGVVRTLAAAGGGRSSGRGGGAAARKAQGHGSGGKQGGQFTFHLFHGRLFLSFWSQVDARTLFNILPAIVWKTGCLRHSVSCVCPPLVHRSVYSPGKNKRTCLCPWRCHEQGQVLNFFKTCGATLLASPKTEATSPGANTPCLCNGRYPAQTTESACALFALPSAVHFRPFGPLPRSLPGSQQPGLSGSALCSFISASSV